MPNSEEPSSYRETFASLARDGSVDRTLMEKMSGPVFSRNLPATSSKMCQKRTC